MLSMRGLECLVAIVEEGSLTKAAAVLHMSQPALSHQIAAIERELGTPVIERLPRGIRPTAAGLVAVAEARIALAAASKVVTSARGAAAGTSGRIRIACAETMTGWLLAPVLRSWHRRFPEVELDLKEFTSADRMLEVLRTGEVVADIFASTTGTDNDMVVKLIDQFPDDDADPKMHGYQLMHAIAAEATRVTSRLFLIFSVCLSSSKRAGERRLDALPPTRSRIRNSV